MTTEDKTNTPRVEVDGKLDESTAPECAPIDGIQLETMLAGKLLKVQLLLQDVHVIEEAVAQEEAVQPIENRLTMALFHAAAGLRSPARDIPTAPQEVYEAGVAHIQKLVSPQLDTLADFFQRVPFQDLRTRAEKTLADAKQQMARPLCGRPSDFYQELVQRVSQSLRRDLKNLLDECSVRLQWRKRRVMVVEDNAINNAAIYWAVADKRGGVDQEHLLSASNRSAAVAALDHLFVGFRGGETLALIANFRIPPTPGTSIRPAMGQSVIDHAHRKVEEWNLAHPESLPVTLEVVLNTHLVDTPEEFQHFGSRWPHLVGYNPEPTENPTGALSVLEASFKRS